MHRLDHLIRERYPTFNDALRDLDDPLSLVHLFAALPSDQKAGVPPAAVAASKALATEWAAWCARSHSLRRAFISVKGYYFQASVRGNQVTWLAPHALAQVLPHDVDFRVMATFLELACTTLRHVLARLYADLGSSYPPRADAALDGAAAGLEALMRGLAAAAVGAIWINQVTLPLQWWPIVHTWPNVEGNSMAQHLRGSRRFWKGSC